MNKIVKSNFVTASSQNWEWNQEERRETIKSWDLDPDSGALFSLGKIRAE